MLEKILPRALEESGSECASIFTSLIMAAHFERSNARELGWRGVHPSASEHPAWTCRVAGCEHVIGVRFEGEEMDAGAPVPSLHGYFSLFLLPRQDSPLLDSFPLSALQAALSPGYEDAVRNFTGQEEQFLPFRFGQLRMDASLDGGAFSLALEAPVRHRVFADDGIPSQDGWLVEPGGAECDVRPFRHYLRFFSTLAATAEQQLGEKARVSVSFFHVPCMRYDARGAQRPDERLREKVRAITAAFGSPALEAQGSSYGLEDLPLRHRPEGLEGRDKPLLHILTGFLGAGKTTFLRRWLDFLHGRERFTGVIQNEFGKVELDAALMKNDTLVEALDDGCVCCSLADSLRPGLERIISAMPAEQFILETTGVANPSNVLEALRKLRDLVVPGIVVCVADALDIRERPDISGVRFEQVHKADAIVLNKSDLVSAEDLEKISRQLRRINDRALLVCASHGNMPFALLDKWIDEHARKRLPSRAPLVLALGRDPSATHEEEGFEAVEIDAGAPVSAGRVEEMIHAAGPGLRRAKGVLDIADRGLCVVQYAAGRLEITPSEEEAPTPLVLIGTGLNKAGTGA